jgi:adenylate cyclase
MPMKSSPKSVFALNPLVITFITTAAMALFYLFGIHLLDMMELKSYDRRFLFKEKRNPSESVVLATIDEKSLNTFGRWPWPRTRMATLLDILSREGAKVIGFNISFIEPAENSKLTFVHQIEEKARALNIDNKALLSFLNDSKKNADTDLILAESIKNCSAIVILGYFFHMSEKDLNFLVTQEEVADKLKRIQPSKYPMVNYEEESNDWISFSQAYYPESNLEIFTQATPYTGHFNMFADPDGVVRWVPLAIKNGEAFFPPLALQCAWHYLNKPKLIVDVSPYGITGIRMGNRFIPTDDKGQMLVAYLGNEKNFPHFSISDILQGNFRKGVFQDKIILIGATAMGISGVVSTPLSNNFTGLEIQATVIGNILQEAFLRRPDWVKFYDLLAIIFIGVLAGIVIPRISAVKGLLFFSIVFITHIVIVRWFFVKQNVWVNEIYFLLTIVVIYTLLTIYRYFTEERERKKLKGAFDQYVPTHVINEVIKDPERLRLGGDEKTLSVLFCDIINFTTYSEYLPPDEIVTLLSNYFKEMTEQVFSFEGTLKEYVGDELMAIFGAPIELPDHAQRACESALAMQQRLSILRHEWVKSGRPALEARIGINSGEMLVGNIGSDYRFSYGVLGDQVNLGSRLEGLNKHYHTRILIGENTAQMVGASFILREVDLVQVMGKKQAVHIYELLGSLKDPVSTEMMEAINRYKSGLEAYRGQRWTEARRCFKSALTIWPEDGPSQVMDSRCEFYEREPPRGHWDGVFRPMVK